MSMLRWRILMSALVVALLGCSADGVGGPQGPQPTCLTFEGERIEALRWNEDGDQLAVISKHWASLVGFVRVVAYPSLDVRVVRQHENVLDLAGVTNDAAGIGWIEAVEGKGNIWLEDGDGGISRVATFPRILIELNRSPRGFLGLYSENGPERIVRVDQSHDPPTLEVDVHGTRVVSSLAVVSGTDRTVYEESDGPGTPLVFVVLEADGSRLVVEPSGRFIGSPELASDAAVVFYADHERGALMKIDARSGETELVLPIDVYSPAISSHLVLGFTYATPGMDDRLCFWEMT